MIEYLKRFAPLVTFNIVMLIVFLYANSAFWSNFSGNLGIDANNPLQISTLRIVYSNVWAQTLQFSNQPVMLITNYPFILFFVSTVGNVCLAALMIRSKSMNKQSIG